MPARFHVTSANLLWCSIDKRYCCIAIKLYSPQHRDDAKNISVCQDGLREIHWCTIHV